MPSRWRSTAAAITLLAASRTSPSGCWSAPSTCRTPSTATWRGCCSAARSAPRRRSTPAALPFAGRRRRSAEGSAGGARPGGGAQPVIRRERRPGRQLYHARPGSGLGQPPERPLETPLSRREQTCSTTRGAVIRRQVRADSALPRGMVARLLVMAAPPTGAPGWRMNSGAARSRCARRPARAAITPAFRSRWARRSACCRAAEEAGYCCK